MKPLDRQLVASCVQTDMAERVVGLSTVVRTEAEERGRRTSVDGNLIARLRDEGMFRILQPVSFGGRQASPTSLFHVQEALSAIDMSTGWLVGNMGIVSHHLAQFDVHAQEAVWGKDGSAILASSNMPGGRLRRDGEGLELSGKWRFSSGSTHADWLMLGARFERGEGDPVVGSCVVRADQVQIEEDWDVLGLRGTGSHAIFVASAHIPTYQFLPHSDRLDGTAPGLTVNDAPLYRIPFPQLQFKAVSTSSIGGLRGMLELFSDQYAERTSAMGQVAREDPHVQELCGTISVELRGMTDAIDSDLTALLSVRDDGDSRERRRREARLNATRTPDRCFRYGADLYRAAGSDAFRVNSAMTRFLLDLVAARQHVANQFEQHARKDGARLMGMELADALL